MTDRLRWGIIGTGAIADRFAVELAGSATGELVAVASRSPTGARAFDARHRVERAFSDYALLIGDDAVDAVYVATPHSEHARWAIRAAEAGKHVLCEKPLTVHRGDAETVIDAAEASGVFLMEAFMYRCHPQTRRLIELLQAGTIGELRVIEAVHSFRFRHDPNGRLLDPALGGGAILDVGCYCTSGARLVAGVASGADGAIEPVEVTGSAHLAGGVDRWAVATLRFPGGVVAHLATGVEVDQPPALRLHGSEGSIELDMPWLPGVDGSRSHEIRVTRADGSPDWVVVETDMGLYASEADEVARCVALGLTESPEVPWADTLGNMDTLDRWRRAVGLVYESERPRHLRTPLRGGPLRVSSSPLPRRRLPGVPIEVSRVVLGTMLALGDETWPSAMAVFDAFYERGGNAFDTARRYGQGESDRALGQWLETRGVREDVAVIAKGAHTPRCDPVSLTLDLERSLADLRTDRAELYLLHRDNPAVPVGEFVDVLNRHRSEGRIRAFGGSNWTMERFDAANRYAAEHGLIGFTAVSNQLSLARMVRPTFPGCLGSDGSEWQAWLQAREVALVAWSSQAAGYFSGVEMGRLARAFDDPANRERRRRAEELGRGLGVPATTVVLAWVLAQPIPVFPIIGPRRLAELRTSMNAFELDLDAAVCAWLDLARDDLSEVV